MNTLKFGNGEWYGKKDTILAYNDENSNFKPLPFSFDRDTLATRVNKEGLIETVGSGEPRIDYKDDSKGALLLEPTRSNLIPYSQDYSQGWNLSSATITSNSITSPNGLVNATTLDISAAGGGLSDSFSVSDGDVTFSLFVKKGTTNGIRLRIDALTDSNGFFDLVNNTVYSSTDDASIESYGNDWYKVSISANITSFSKVAIYGTNGEGGYQNGTIYIYGAQFEQGSYATSYIPTSGGVVTRVAEQGIDGGAGTPIFSNTSAVWFIDLERIGVDTDSSGSAMALRNSSFSQQIRLHFDFPAQYIRFRDGVNGYATISTITGANPNVRKKLALRINGSTLSTFSNGNKIGNDYTAPNAFNLEEIDFSSIGFKIHDMRFYNTALTDQELIALTTI